MAKMKVHELAKELEIQSKEVLAFLQEKGFEVVYMKPDSSGSSVQPAVIFLRFVQP